MKYPFGSHLSPVDGGSTLSLWTANTTNRRRRTKQNITSGMRSDGSSFTMYGMGMIAQISETRGRLSLPSDFEMFLWSKAVHNGGWVTLVLRSKILHEPLFPETFSHSHKFPCIQSADWVIQQLSGQVGGRLERNTVPHKQCQHMKHYGGTGHGHKFIKPATIT